jgi:hypothetical protein
MRYALFQHSLDELDAGAVGDALDEAVPWLARADARMLVRRAYGVLVEGLIEPHARDLAQALAGRGVSVDRVEQDWLELPPILACRRADVQPGGLVVYDLYGRVTEVPWARVLMVAAGSYPVPERVPQARKAFEPQPRIASPWGLRGLLPEGSAELGQTSYEYVDRAQIMLDIVTDAPARYRIQRQRFDYSYLGERRGASAAANFPLLVRDVLEHAPGAVQNQGLRLMRSDAGEVMSYPGPNQFEREIAWSLWRFLGPGTRLDAGDPYRSASAMMMMRLTAPLMRAASPGVSRASVTSGNTAVTSGNTFTTSGKTPAKEHAAQPSAALATRGTSALARSPGLETHAVDVSLAVLAGVAVAVAGWWVQPLSMVLALPVMRIVYQRMLRRRVQRHYGAAPADDDAGDAQS